MTWSPTRKVIKTSETISDSADCYAGLPVRFESSAAWSNVTCWFKAQKQLSTTVCQDGFKLCCDVLGWISLILNSLIRWSSKRDNFIFSTPTFVTWYFCFPRKVCNMIPLFSQKHTKEDMLIFFLLEKNEIMLLTYEKNGRGMILLGLLLRVRASAQD